MEIINGLPDLGIGVIELSFKNDEKTLSSKYRLKSIQSGYAMTERSLNKNSPYKPSGPTDQLSCRRDKPLKTLLQVKKTLLGKSKGSQFRLIALVSNVIAE